MNLDFWVKNRKWVLKILAALILLSAAVVVYRQKTAGAADEIIITGADGTAYAETDGAPAEPPPESDAPPQEAEEVRTIVVDVAGAVNGPAVLILPEGSRVYEAIALAGGLTAQAEMQNINQATPLKDGDRLYIPAKGEAPVSASAASAPAANAGIAGNNGTGITNADSPVNDAAEALVNLNTADSAALQKLSGVGPATAEKIIDYRNQNGSFKTIEDLMNVSGIGSKTFEKLKDKISV
ncbi:MAG: helix-hairpin-helix domain-containing protein [Clostridiales Family XIII bacterium]|jgi:competence protein ComEA|nr:helix-hairpin-helix domain-containing protein [Clostridiales Family XIII bacterium]